MFNSPHTLSFSFGEIKLWIKAFDWTETIYEKFCVLFSTREKNPIFFFE